MRSFVGRATLVCTTLVLVSVLAVGRAEGAPVVVTAQGHITTVGPGLSSLNFAVDDSFVMTYTFDPDLPDIAGGDPTIGYYQDPAGALSLSMSGYDISGAVVGAQIETLFDIWSFGVSSTPLPSTLPAPWSVQSLNWTVQGPGTNLGGVDSLIVAPDLSLTWPHNVVSLLLNVPVQTYIFGTVTSVSVEQPAPPTSVPEPSSLLLLGMGAAALSGLYRGRSRTPAGDVE